MELITYERALEIKEFLDSIRDVLSDPMVNKLWAINMEVYNPANRIAPCTCAPREWRNIIDTLKRDIGTIIESHEQSIVKEEIVAENQDMVAKTGRKSKK